MASPGAREGAKVTKHGGLAPSGGTLVPYTGLDCHDLEEVRGFGKNLPFFGLDLIRSAVTTQKIATAAWLFCGTGPRRDRRRESAPPSLISAREPPAGPVQPQTTRLYIGAKRRSPIKGEARSPPRRQPQTPRTPFLQ